MWHVMCVVKPDDMAVMCMAPLQPNAGDWVKLVLSTWKSLRLFHILPFWELLLLLMMLWLMSEVNNSLQWGFEVTDIVSSYQP
jgi:hypothetical protein